MARGEREEKKPGPSKGQAFGVASVTQALEGADFPASKDELIREFGNHEVHYTKDNPMQLKNLLQEVDQDEFGSMSELTSAVSAVMREGREEEGRSGGRTGRGHGQEEEEGRSRKSARSNEEEE